MFYATTLQVKLNMETFPLHFFLGPEMDVVRQQFGEGEKYVLSDVEYCSLMYYQDHFLLTWKKVRKMIVENEYHNTHNREPQKDFN